MNSRERLEWHNMRPRLAEFRNVWAHPDKSRDREGTLICISKHITSALDMAKLLEDTAAIRKLENILHRLEAKARRWVDYCNHRLLLPHGETPWPRHLERTFETMDFLTETEKNQMAPEVRAAEVVYHLDWRGPGERRVRKRRRTSRAVSLDVRRSVRRLEWEARRSLPS